MSEQRGGGGGWGGWLSSLLRAIRPRLGDTSCPCYHHVYTFPTAPSFWKVAATKRLNLSGKHTTWTFCLCVMKWRIGSVLSAHRPSDKEGTAGFVHLEENSCCCVMKMKRSYFDIWAFCFQQLYQGYFFNLWMEHRSILSAIIPHRLGEYLGERKLIILLTAEHVSEL